MTTIELASAAETRTAIERGILIFLVLGPCQELASRRPNDEELAGIIEQLRATMTQSVEHLSISATELALPIEIGRASCRERV